MEEEMTDYIDYAVQLRRELHRHPEIGFDLPKTLALVRRELDAYGISYTEEYGKSSIVATINPECKGFTIGLRGDMDALPITEETDCDFKSEEEGRMHACGHDIHTAIMLGTARRLQEKKEELRCRVKILFTPAEEYITPGCEALANNGVMDDIDCAVACHVAPNFEVGSIALLSGGFNANSMGMTVEFFGTSAHANAQQKGKDAIRMAVEAYMAMENMAAKELDPTEPKVLNIGVFEGGHTNNVICDYCKLFLTIRTHCDEVTDFMHRRIEEICCGIAMMHGGHAKVTVNKRLPYVLNDDRVVKALEATAKSVVGEAKIFVAPRTLGGEDFGFLSRKKPCAMFRLGSRSELPGTDRTLHNAGVVFDEGCISVGIDMFTGFVLDYQEGIEGIV